VSADTFSLKQVTNERDFVSAEWLNHKPLHKVH